MFVWTLGIDAARKPCLRVHLYKRAHLSHVFTPYLPIAPRRVKYKEWPGDANEVSCFYLKEKTPTKLAHGSVSH